MTLTWYHVEAPLMAHITLYVPTVLLGNVPGDGLMAPVHWSILPAMSLVPETALEDFRRALPREDGDYAVFWSVSATHYRVLLLEARRVVGYVGNTPPNWWVEPEPAGPPTTAYSHLV